jgi:uncharacterized repeat protein (TIGR01451 family)
LSGANDEVEIVIDGFFKQAGNFTALFNATRDATSEQTSLNMLAVITALPVDLSVTKEVKPSGGNYGSSTSVPIGSTVTFHIIVKNTATPASDHSTDVALGSRFHLNDKFISQNQNDVVLTMTAKSFACIATGGADCVQVPGGPITTSLYSANQETTLYQFNYSSNGLLPAGASFEITFDAEITTSSQCSPKQDNAIVNDAFFTYSDGMNSLGDTVSGNNTSDATVKITGIPPTGCLPPPTADFKKELLSTPAWNTPLKYRVTITNTSLQTLTGLGLYDWVWASGTPPVTATFAPDNLHPVVCNPACIATLPSSTGLIHPGVSSPYVFQKTPLFAPLPRGEVQTIEYWIQYDAGCSLTSGRGLIQNIANLTGPLSKTAWVDATMPELPLCVIDVTKKRTSGPQSFSTYPATVGFHVDFKNLSQAGSVTVRTLMDAIALKSKIYGDVPIHYSYTCTATNVTLPSGAQLIKLSTPATVTWNDPLRAGVRLIDFSSSAGAVFGVGGLISCDMSITFEQPRTDDAFCQGDGDTDLINSAFMDLRQSLFNTNYVTPAKEATQSITLPKCVAVSVGKTVGPNVVAGGGVTFTLTVTNAAKTGTISNLTLHDQIPASFTNVTWTCVSGCATNHGVAQNVDVSLQPIAAAATTTIVVQANAPTALGTYCNDTNATFDPFPALSYFEGDQSKLLHASACAQVETPPGLIIHKEVSGAPSGYTAQFQFEVKCTTPAGPYQKTVTFGWPSPGFIAVNDIPPNSQCRVTEGAVPNAPAGYAWFGAPQYTPTDGVISLGEKGGPVSVVNRLIPEECLRIVASTVTCEVDANGKPTGRYIWKFRFKNISGSPASHLFVSGLPFPVTVNDDDLEFIPAVTSLSPWNTLIFSGASPGPLTFNLSLHCGTLEDCCSTPVMIDLPSCDCAQIVGEHAPSCSFPNPNPLSYTMTLQNLSLNTVENLLIVPVSSIDHVTAVPPSSITVTTEVNHVAAAGQGGTIGPVTVKLSGAQAKPGTEVCLSIGLEDKDFKHCCSIVRCFRLPDCSIHGTDVHSLGDALVAQLEEGFRIDHIGTSGNDGISIDLHDALNAGLAWLPLDGAGALPNSSFIELRGVGNPGQTKGNVRVTQTAIDRYEITSSIDDARTYRIEVFRGTDRVLTATQPGINIIVIWPVAAGVELVPSARSGDPDTLGFTLQTAVPVAWQLADGTAVVGDRMRVIPEESSGQTASLQRLELRASRIPSIVVAGVSIAHDCNGNAISDAEEITSGSLADDNGNGIPDQCEGEPVIDVSLNTGFDQSTDALLPVGVLPEGTNDDDWKVVSAAPEISAKIVISPHPNWAAAFDMTRWISFNPNRGLSSSATSIIYERCFCLGADARDISLDLQLRADNEASVLLNGQTLAGPGGAFNGVPLVVHRNGSAGDGLFVAGRNCLRVNVTDFGGFTGLDLSGSLKATGHACSTP